LATPCHARPLLSAPTPTLFPYPTLFRSPPARAVRRAAGATAVIDDELWSAIGDPTRRRMLDLLLANGGGTATSLSDRLPVTRQADRKSTRLNSSHEWTSYAVFFVKKKNY